MSRLNVLLTLALVFLLAPHLAEAQSSRDPYEPNNDFGQAHGPLAERTTYSAALTDEDRDFYYIQVGRGGRVVFTLRPLDKEMGLTLYDNDEAPLAFLPATTRQEGRLEQELGAGRYFIKVHGELGYGMDSSRYELRLVSDVLLTTPIATPAPITDPGRCAYFPSARR